MLKSFNANTLSYIPSGVDDYALTHNNPSFFTFQAQNEMKSSQVNLAGILEL